MSFRGALGIKRKRPGSDGLSKELTADERAVYDLIKSTGNMGIWKGDVKKELNITNIKVVDNCAKSLTAKNLIKEVGDIKSKGRKRLMASEFEPSTELTGGVWYSEGALDSDLIENLKRACVGILRIQNIATADGILHKLNKSGAFTFELILDHVKHVLDNLCLEKRIIRVKSNGLGEFGSFPRNSDCYKLKTMKKDAGAMASIPCGVCPRINQCDPDGIISPVTCEYYTKWLDF